MEIHMTDNATPTLPELLAQQAAIERQIAAASLAGVQSAQAVLDAGSVATLADELEAILPDLVGSASAQQQVTNVVTVLRNVPNSLAREAARLEGLAAEPQPQEAA
jgi:hypothetical protein